MRICKICKVKFEPIYSSVQPTCSIKCAIAYAKLQTKKKQEKKIKEINKDVRERKITTHTKQYKAELQKEINKLSKQIDSYFGYKCIDCGKDYGNLVHGAHFNNVQGNENIRFNLHNIHSARAHCNMYNSEHKVGYTQGLKNRYSEEYYNFVAHKIGLKYKSIKLLPKEVHDALKIVRKLNRDFDTMVFTDSISARNILNAIIGIYL